LCRLIHSGHVSPWEYGWEFFKAATEHYGEYIVEMACIARVAQHADNKEWKKFVDKNRKKEKPSRQVEPFIPPFARRREKRKIR
jgi:hypothetical protein